MDAADTGGTTGVLYRLSAILADERGEIIKLTRPRRLRG